MTNKKVILTERAPAPIGPYSQAVEAAGFVFISGQIPLDAKTGQVIEGDVAAQTKKVMENLSEILKTAECSWDSVVKTTIFLKSMADFPKVNEVYGTYFKGNPPARATIEVSRLPKDVAVEIEAVAARSV